MYPVVAFTARSSTITFGNPKLDPAFDQLAPESVVMKTPTSVPAHQVEVGVTGSRAMAFKETAGRLLALAPVTNVNVGLAA